MPFLFFPRHSEVGAPVPAVDPSLGTGECGIELEDDSGLLLLEDGSGFVLLEVCVVVGKSKTPRYYPPGSGPVDVSYGRVPELVFQDEARGALRLRGFSTDVLQAPARLSGWSWDEWKHEVGYADVARGAIRLTGFSSDAAAYNSHDARTGRFVITGHSTEVFDDGAIIRQDLREEEELFLLFA